MKKICRKFMICAICALLAAMPFAEICTAQPAAAAEKSLTPKTGKTERTAKAKKKVLIAYYSQSGTTEKVAKRIEKMTGATMFRIQTKKKYPSEYEKLTGMALKEQEAKARPALKKKVKSMKNYGTVILGFPIWWDDAPMAVYSFLESYDLSGKTILPFCTSGGSDISTSVKHIRKVCKKSTVKNGLTANEVSDKKLKSWLEKNQTPLKENISVQLQIGKTRITNKTYQMKAGTSVNLKAAATEKIRSVKYTSSAPKVASVSSKGVIKAKKTGTVKITAEVKTKQVTKKAWMRVKVSEPISDPKPEPEPEPTPEPEPNPGPAEDESTILIVYFTRTGNTEAIADIISEKTGGAKVRLETVKTYPADYSSILDEAMEEKNTNARPQLRTKIENMDKYKTVFVGYPIWHGDAPMAVRTFLESYDFTGKKVVPFCTSGSSRPDTSFAHVEESAQGAEILEGFWTGSSGLGKIEETVPQWLERLSLPGSGADEGGIGGGKMKVTVGDTVYTANLTDNSSSEALRELLAQGPLTINMSDYANMEKVGPIGQSLPRNDRQISAGPGDIILYQGDSLVIYYGTNSWNFTHIGKIEGVTGEELLKVFGDGNVTVTFYL